MIKGRSPRISLVTITLAWICSASLGVGSALAQAARPGVARARGAPWDDFGEQWPTPVPPWGNCVSRRARQFCRLGAVLALALFAQLGGAVAQDASDRPSGAATTSSGAAPSNAEADAARLVAARELVAATSGKQHLSKSLEQLKKAVVAQARADHARPDPSFEAAVHKVLSPTNPRLAGALAEAEEMSVDFYVKHFSTHELVRLRKLELAPETRKLQRLAPKLAALVLEPVSHFLREVIGEASREKGVDAAKSPAPMKSPRRRPAGDARKSSTTARFVAAKEFFVATGGKEDVLRGWEQTMQAMMDSLEATWDRDRPSLQKVLEEINRLLVPTRMPVHELLAELEDITVHFYATNLSTPELHTLTQFERLPEKRKFRAFSPQLDTRLSRTLLTLQTDLMESLKQEEAIHRAERNAADMKARHGAESVEHAEALRKLAATVASLDKAEALYRNALAIDEKRLGRDNLGIVTSLVDLGHFLRETNRMGEAGELLRRAVTITESAVGPNHPQLAERLNDLSGLLYDIHRVEEAEPLMRRALGIMEANFDPHHPGISRNLHNLALLLQREGRWDETEAILHRLLAMAEKSFDGGDPRFAARLQDVAEFYATQAKYAEAEGLLRRALAINETVLGRDHPEIAKTLNHLAASAMNQEKEVEAEELRRRILAITETNFGPAHPDVATALYNLSLVLKGTQRSDSAGPLLERALAIREKKLGPDHSLVGSILEVLAGVYDAQNRQSEAARMRERALEISDKDLRGDNWERAVTLANLASRLRASGDLAKAESLNRRAIAMHEKVGSPAGPLASAMTNLAFLLEDQDRDGEAEELYRRARSISESSGVYPDFGLAVAITGLARLLEKRGDWDGAVALYQGAKPLALDGIALREANIGPDGRSAFTALAAFLARALHRAAHDDERARAEAFEMAQWASHSRVTSTLSQVAARFAKGTGPLARLVRERQDLEMRRPAVLRRLDDATAQGDRKAQEDARASVARIDDALKEVDARLDQPEFGGYAALTRPKPLAIAEAQERFLRDDEVLIQFMEYGDRRRVAGAGETLVWAVTKTEAHWLSVPLDYEAFHENVRKLRCGLDRFGEWYRSEDRWFARNEVCRLLAPGGLGKEDLLPFDHRTAHKLYKVLFGELEARGMLSSGSAGKHLIVVSAGPIAELPLHVLLTKEPDGALDSAAALKSAAWLARRHVITTLPAVSSLKDLRGNLGRSSAANAMIGFGNPTLDGRPDEQGNEIHRAAAAYRQSCDLPPSPEEESIQLSERLRSSGRVALGSTTTAESIKRWSPVPGTATLLCDLAKDPAFVGNEVHLGHQATKHRVKELSTTGALASYRAIHFATHGVLAGQIKGISEPGLILSPTAGGTEEDNGYLSASEIAELKLDADAVILSACNTAAAGDRGGEALSGLARAFIYAQTRALVVSHWYVYEDAAVRLIAETLKQANRPDMGLSMALQQAILRLIDTGPAHQVHPAYWAPFVVVGEGAAAKP